MRQRLALKRDYWLNYWIIIHDYRLSKLEKSLFPNEGTISFIDF